MLTGFVKFTTDYVIFSDKEHDITMVNYKEIQLHLYLMEKILSCDFGTSAPLVIPINLT